MLLFERDIDLPIVPGHRSVLQYLSERFSELLPSEAIPLRFAITRSDHERYHCEVAALAVAKDNTRIDCDSIFRFVRRPCENTEAFNAVLVVPTGVGAEIGGHAGDATPVARLLATACDALITHPNVVSASDINEIPENGIYVEGSVISRLLMGTVGLQRVRSNRVLVVVEPHDAQIFLNSTINSVSAARATYGLRCVGVVVLDSRMKMDARYTDSGSAVGRVEKLEALYDVLDHEGGRYDAVAIASIIGVPEDFHMEYFRSAGAMVNPWGGVEAMLTHSISMMYNVPAAHAPMMESEKIVNMDVGVVDPRMAAEAVSMTFLNCVLKGLHRSPKIVTDPEAMHHHSTITASDISVLVIPDGCIGLPTLAALEQGIPVIAVRENRNLMKNDLTALPWADGQLHIVENYWEAAGVMLAMKAGIAPESVRRPLAPTAVRGIDTAGESQGSPGFASECLSATTDSKPPVSSVFPDRRQ